MATLHNVTLTLSDGTMCDAWDRYTLSLSMLRAGQPWTFSLWRSRDRQSAWDVLARKVKLFDTITVSVDGHAQLTGRIETLTRQAHGHGECVMVISGRDLSGSAQSWDADPTVSIRNVTLESALESIFSPLGLTVRLVDAAAARAVQSARPASSQSMRRRRSPIDRAHPKPGEKAWSLAQSIVRRLGFMLWCAPRADGSVGIVVDVPDYDQSPSYTLTRRLSGAGVGSGNVLGASEAFSVREVPTDATVYTGSVRGAATSARSRAVVVNADIFNPDISRGFVSAVAERVIQPRHARSDRARTVLAAEREAERIIADAMAGFYTYTATVQGHGQLVDGSPRLYAVNTTARVVDDVMIDATGSPLNRVLFVTDVEMSGSRQSGQTTTLTLVPLNSIVITPET